jgi:hypothetical protein
MWTDLRKEIETIRKDFSLTDIQFRPLGLSEWQGIEDKIYQTFCKLTHYKSRPVWLWENFKLDTFSVSTEHKPYHYLDKLIDDTETVWFFVNETVNEADKFWFYQGQVKPIETIIAEACYIDEFYLVSKKYDWLICINHHDVLIATGLTMPDKLRQFEISINQPK